MSTWTHIGPASMMVRLEPRQQRAGAIIRAGHRELIMKIARREQVALNTVALELVPGEGVELPKWAAGAHIDLVLPGEMIRAYSLVNAPSGENLWRIAVLREDKGRGGSVGMHRLAQGDEIRVRLPRNTFKLQAAPHYHFFASGIGITPIYAMIHEAEANGASWRLDYVGRSRDQMAFADNLARFAQVNLHLTGDTGRPDLQQLLSQSAAEVPIYSCGSTGFLSALEEACTTAERDFHTEWFSPRPGSRQAAAGAYESFSVRLERSNVEVYVQPGQSIIDACGEAGVMIQGACFEGTCGSCMCGVVEGTPDHRDSFLTSKERAANKLIAPCVSKSMTSRLVLDL